MVIAALGHDSMHIFIIYYIHSLYGITQLGERKKSYQLRVP